MLHTEISFVHLLLLDPQQTSSWQIIEYSSEILLGFVRQFLAPSVNIYCCNQSLVGVTSGHSVLKYKKHHSHQKLFSVFSLIFNLNV